MARTTRRSPTRRRISCSAEPEMNMLCLRRPAGRCRPTVLALALLSAFAPATGRADEVLHASVGVGAGLIDHGRAARALSDQYSGLRPNDPLFGVFGADYYRRNEA